MDATKTKIKMSKSRMSPKNVSNQSNVTLGCNLTQVTWVNLGLVRLCIGLCYSAIDIVTIPWCSGHDICLRRRCPEFNSLACHLSFSWYLYVSLDINNLILCITSSICSNFLNNEVLVQWSEHLPLTWESGVQCLIRDLLLLFFVEIAQTLRAKITPFQQKDFGKNLPKRSTNSTC